MKVHKQQELKANEGENDVIMDEDDKGQELEGEDPFDFECLDPKECRANESSLWELKSLINHFEYKTSGHCFQAVTHFRDKKMNAEKGYKRVPMNLCHMFEYHKLLNYYFIKNHWFLKNMANEKEREKMEKEEGNGASGGWKAKRWRNGNAGRMAEDK